MSMDFKFELPTPDDIIKMFPLSDAAVAQKAKNDEAVRKIITGESNKFLLIIGPCSADRADAVLDYNTRLRKVQEKVSDKIVIVPRIYTNKPRTTGAGYKGMLHQAHPTDQPDFKKGLIAIRSLHVNSLEQTGFSAADEMLYPENHRYLADVLTYVAVGARSVENQQHRLTASGFDLPVGMKNPTSGDLSVMINAITAAQSSHTFAYGGWEVQTTGNLYAHAILRGLVDKYGKTTPNYHYEDLALTNELYQKSGLKNPAVIIDCNHSNSGKKYIEQIRISKEVLHSKRHSEDINKLIKGLMIESYIEDGNQKIEEGVYGKSITDACLGWEKTEKLIYEIADLL